MLTRALHDDEPLLREHAAWALARLARDAPSAARDGEEPLQVRDAG